MGYRQPAADQPAAPSVPGPASPDLDDEPGPHWDLRVEIDGRLKAVLTGSNPPLTVTGQDLASVRKQIKIIVLRGLL